MILTTTLLLLLAAGPSVEDTRKQYSNCLVKEVIKALDANMPWQDFGSAAKTLCEKEQGAFRTAVAAAEKSYGSSDSDANAYAGEEVTNIIDSQVNAYPDYQASKTRPSPE